MHRPDAAGGVVPVLEQRTDRQVGVVQAPDIGQAGERRAQHERGRRMLDGQPDRDRPTERFPALPSNTRTVAPVATGRPGTNQPRSLSPSSVSKVTSSPPGSTPPADGTGPPAGR